MSETDTESSCGWTVISPEGSDIETLGAEAMEEVEPECELQRDTVSDVTEDALEDTAPEERLGPSETGVDHVSLQHVSVSSGSDHSDILTLGNVKEEELVLAEASEVLDLRMSCCRQFSFTSAPTVLVSSSEEERDLNCEVLIRRRRVRRNTPNSSSEQDQSQRSEAGEREERGQEQREEEKLITERQSRGSSNLTTFMFLALVITASTGFGHFYSSTQLQERASVDGLRDMIIGAVEWKGDLSLDEVDVQKAILLLSQTIHKMRKENEDLRVKLAQIQVEKDDLVELLKSKAKQRGQTESQLQSLQRENYRLQLSLKKEEKSLSLLLEELRTLRLTMKDFETVRAGANSLFSENQRLKAELEEEKALIREAQTLRKDLDTERHLTEELRGEINKLRQRISGAEKVKDLQIRLDEMEKKLSFEKQRSDLWERLYLENKEERAKGDSDPKLKKSKVKEGMAGKVKETFESVKNSTEEFVQHHKQRIKKAKAAMKENLRKFSDSVKSTFRNFKDSASNIFKKAQGFYDKKHNKNSDDAWQEKPAEPNKKPFKFNFDYFQSDHFSRNSAEKVREKFKPQSCSEVFDCAYQEFMSLFDKAAEPVRADEFYQLLQSYLQKELDHVSHWKELEQFINNFFRNGLFIHDQMLFTDFVNDVEDYLTHLYKHQGLTEDFFEDLDDYVYRHFFGETYSKNSTPSGPFERPDSKEHLRQKHRRKQHKSRHGSERKWSRSERHRDRHRPDVKIELGPMPFHPKY